MLSHSMYIKVSCTYRAVDSYCLSSANSSFKIYSLRSINLMTDSDRK